VPSPGGPHSELGVGIVIQPQTLDLALEAVVVFQVRLAERVEVDVVATVGARAHVVATQRRDRSGDESHVEPVAGRDRVDALAVVGADHDRGIERVDQVTRDEASVGGQREHAGTIGVGCVAGSRRDDLRRGGRDLDPVALERTRGGARDRDGEAGRRIGTLTEPIQRVDGHADAGAGRAVHDRVARQVVLVHAVASQPTHGLTGREPQRLQIVEELRPDHSPCTRHVDLDREAVHPRGRGVLLEVAGPKRRRDAWVSGGHIRLVETRIGEGHGLTGVALPWLSRRGGPKQERREQGIAERASHDVFLE
jgi:hypothetical protein